eukprot:3925254-Pyramimonas_sp.AAC.1
MRGLHPCLLANLANLAHDRPGEAHPRGPSHPSSASSAGAVPTTQRAYAQGGHAYIHPSQGSGYPVFQPYGAHTTT